MGDKKERTNPTNQPAEYSYDLDQEPIILFKATLDKLLQQDKPADLIALYTFYYYTAKWQKTNKPKATTGYAAKGLKWPEARVRSAKNVLKELGLVQDVPARDKETNSRIVGWYIQVNFICSRATEEKYYPNDFLQGRNFYSVENPEGNALSTDKLNALSNNSINTYGGANGDIGSTPEDKETSSPKKKTEPVWRRQLKLFPQELANDRAFHKAWKDYCDHRAQHNAPRYTDTGLKKKIAQLLKQLGTCPTSWVEAIDHSITNNWRGIFPKTSNGNGKRYPQQNATITERTDPSVFRRVDLTI